MGCAVKNFAHRPSLSSSIQSVVRVSGRWYISYDVKACLPQPPATATRERFGQSQSDRGKIDACDEAPGGSDLAQHLSHYSPFCIPVV